MLRRLRLSTAGESHGPAEVSVLAGLPSGIPLTSEDVDRDLARRQRGYGRGGRQKIEKDRVTILSGVRLGRTMGSPVSLLVENADHAAWRVAMAADPGEGDPALSVTVPRPGHADLAGAAKHGLADMRDVLERSSARETVARVAAGALTRAFLRRAGVTVAGRVSALGGVEATEGTDYSDPGSVDWHAVEESEFGCALPGREAAMRALVDQARAEGESLGGIFEIWAWGLVPGLGGYAQVEERLDGRLAFALASIPAIKGVEIGLGFASAGLRGSQVHDAICLDARDESALVSRSSNRAGGLEGGMTTGQPLILRAAMKPIPTLTRALPSVELATFKETVAHRERSDIEAVAAARVVGEAMTCLVLADAYLEKFGGDTLVDFQGALGLYQQRLAERRLWPWL